MTIQKNTARQQELALPRRELNTDNVFSIDCLSLLKRIDDKSVDLIATDPPYCINYDNQKWDKPDSLNWKVLSQEFKRILKDSGAMIVFQGWSEVAKIKDVLDDLFTLQNWIIYDRIKGRGTKINLVSTREDILWYVNNTNLYTYNKIPSTIKKKTGGSIGKKNGNAFRALSNVWTDISPIVPWSNERVQHPTQKPLSIMERIITVFSNPNDLVIDPFMGSGTTLVAAKKLNRNYMGCDNNKEFYDIAIDRLNNV